MSGDFPLQLSGKRSDGTGFWGAPDLDFSLYEGRSRVYASTPLTPNTGAQLRALADDADALWAEWSASPEAKKGARA